MRSALRGRSPAIGFVRKTASSAIIINRSFSRNDKQQ